MSKSQCFLFQTADYPFGHGRNDPPYYFDGAFEILHLSVNGKGDVGGVEVWSSEKVEDASVYTGYPLGNQIRSVRVVDKSHPVRDRGSLLVRNSIKMS
jgi:hypothetical protein